MTKKKLKALILLLVVILLVGCGGNVVKEESEAQSVQTDESREESELVVESEEESGTIEKDEEAAYQITSILPETVNENQYHWVILQAGRSNVNQRNVNQINEVLKESGLSSSIVFHIVETEEYITPDVLEEVSEQLDGKMDFVSMSPTLTAFSKEEWQNTFVDLTEKLKTENSELSQFYQTVPEAAWNANEIAGGMYSFSNATYVKCQGLGFYKEACDMFGEENLIKLQQANGIEDESIWAELYDLYQQQIGMWSGLQWGVGIGGQERVYDRSTLSGITNGWDTSEFAFLTDDVRYNKTTKKFEWLGNSETYLKLKNTVKQFAEKGYIRAHDSVGAFEYHESDWKVGMVLGSYSNEYVKNEENIDSYTYLWVPSGKLQVVQYPMGLRYVHSCVYKNAQNGWEEILNVIGANEEVSDIINQRYHMTISSLVYQDDWYGMLLKPAELEDTYVFIEKLYAEAEPNPLQGFVFNPLPVVEEWNDCNKTAYGLASWEFVYYEYEQYEEEDGTIMQRMVESGADLEAIDEFWSAYTQAMKEAGIEKIVEEVNRQYQEWQQS